MSPLCGEIMDSQQNYGPTGQDLANEISKRYSSDFAGARSLEAVCPRFASVDKVKAWVWFFTVLANEESGCRPQVVHATHLKNGSVLNPRLGFGLWAMEYADGVRAGRGPLCEGNIRDVHLAGHMHATHHGRTAREQKSVLSSES